MLSVADLLPVRVEHEKREAQSFAPELSLLRSTAMMASSVLLSGPPESGKTYFLFSYATRLAAQNKEVLFICSNRDKLRATLPYLEHLVTSLAGTGGTSGTSGTSDGAGANDRRARQKKAAATSAEILKRIHIKYIDTSAKLRCFLASLHVANTTAPSAIIVDDFYSFFGDAAATPPVFSHAVAKTSAFLCEARAFLARVNGLGACSLLISDTLTHPLLSPTAFLELMEKWFPVVLQLAKLPHESSHAFQLGILRAHKEADASKLAVQYRLMENGLVLDLLSATPSAPRLCEPTHAAGVEPLLLSVRAAT